MTLERYEPVAAVSHIPPAARALVEWAQAAQAAHELAESLVRTAFAPAQYRGKPGEATAAILAGSEVGLSPMASLRAFDIIAGVATPRALTLRAIVQSLGHEIIVDESTTTRARGRARRRDSKEWQTAEWTMDRARQLGLTGKDPWKRQPTAMLVARLTSELARLVAADAILGIGYSAEELGDDDTVTITPPTPAKAVRGRTTRRKPAPEPEPETEPDFDEPTTPATEAVDTEPEPDLEDGGSDPITPPQSKLLHKLMRERFGGDRDTSLTAISEQLRRPIETTKELTVADASELIDWLSPEPEDEA